MTFRIASFAAVAALGLTSAAHATELQFSYSGPNGTFEFVDSDTPVVTNSGSNGSYPFYNEISPTGSVNGSPSNFGGGIMFGSSYNGGGLEFADYTLGVAGPQIFSGSVTAPTFAVGTYNVTVSLYQYSGQSGTLTISDYVAPTSVSAAPEPSMWALMIAGVGMIGAMLRSGRRRRAVAAA